MASASEEISDLVQAKAQETLKLLRTNLDVGLTEAEVEIRLKQYGYNKSIVPRSSGGGES